MQKQKPVTTTDKKTIDARIRWDDIAQSTSLAGSIGFQLVIPPVAGVLMGVWVDGMYASKPFFTLSFLGIGVCITFFSLYTIVRKFI